MGMPTFREIMEAEERRHLERAQEIARDKKELERIVSKYNLVVVAVPEKPLPPAEKISRTNFSRAAREAEAIIRAAGHPMPINDLFRIVVTERGIELGGREPTGNFSASMAAGKKLQYIKDVGWWVKGVPWPPTAEDMAKLQGPLVDELEEHVSVWPRSSPEKQQLFKKVRVILRGRTEPMKFAELFDRIKETGLHIGGTNERQNFAVFMTKFSCFSSYKRQGWRYLPERDFSEDKSD